MSDDARFLLGQIDGKLDALMDSFDKHSERHDKLEARVRGVEGKQSWISGAWGMAGTAAGAVMVWIKSHA